MQFFTGTELLYLHFYYRMDYGIDTVAGRA